MSDAQIITMEAGDADEISDLVLAKQIGEALNNVYPNHPWVVGFQGRGLVIRHLSIAGEVSRVLGKDGFSSLLPRDKLGTHKQVVKAATMFGGELLEAFGLPRGRWDGRTPVVPRAWTHGKQDKFH